MASSGLTYCASPSWALLRHDITILPKIYTVSFFPSLLQRDLWLFLPEWLCCGEKEIIRLSQDYRTLTELTEWPKMLWPTVQSSGLCSSGSQWNFSSGSPQWVSRYLCHPVIISPVLECKICADIVGNRLNQLWVCFFKRMNSLLSSSPDSYFWWLFIDVDIS